MRRRCTRIARRAASGSGPKLRAVASVRGSCSFASRAGATPATRYVVPPNGTNVTYAASGPESLIDSTKSRQPRSAPIDTGFDSYTPTGWSRRVRSSHASAAACASPGASALARYTIAAPSGSIAPTMRLPFEVRQPDGKRIWKPRSGCRKRSPTKMPDAGRWPTGSPSSRRSSAARPSARAGSRRKRISLARTDAAAARSLDPGCVSKKPGVLEARARSCSSSASARRKETSARGS